MFWDGTRWVHDPARTPARPPTPTLADWIATAMTVILLVALVMPFSAMSGRSQFATRGPSSTAGGGTEDRYEETDERLVYTGSWVLVTGPAYSGGAVLQSDQARARMTLRFAGTGLSWIAPTGPAQGRARVLVDGRLMKNVNTRSDRVAPSRVLYSITFDSRKERTLVIEVAGTAGHPVVPIDAVTVTDTASGENPAPTPETPADPTIGPDPTAETTPPATASPRPTASPTPRPTAAPAPTPRPTSAPTPTPAPTPDPGSCTRTVNVDSSGSSDVTSSLQSFLDNSPNGSVVCFASGGTYQVRGQLHLVNRQRMTFLGRGARIYQPVRTDRPILLVDGGGNDLVFRNLIVEGSNPRPGWWERAYEHNHGIALGGAVSIEFDRVDVINVGGDGLYLSGGAGRWANDIWFHDGLFQGIGRMGVAVTDGATNVVIEQNTFRRIGYYTFDIEPNGVSVGGTAAGGTHIRFSDNTLGTQPFGTYPRDASQAYGYVFAVTGSSGGGPAVDINVTRNRMTDSTWGDFRVGVFNNGGARRDIRVTNNIGAERVAGPVMTFAGIDGLTVTGNTQPLLSGSLVSTSACSSVTIHNNNTD